MQPDIAQPEVLQEIPDSRAFAGVALIEEAGIADQQHCQQEWPGKPDCAICKQQDWFERTHQEGHDELFHRVREGSDQG